MGSLLGSLKQRGSRLGIGTAALTVPYGPPGLERAAPDPAVARRVLLMALERGVRVIDTAPAYGDAETLLGGTLGQREDCWIATKLAIPAAGWDALSPPEIRVHVRASVRASLRALRRERLDLIQIHNAERSLVREGAVGEALAELREQGLVNHVGATVYGEANALAVIDSPHFDAVQVAFSALDRRPELRVLPAAAATGTAVLARSLLLRGVLSPAGRDLGGAFEPLSRAADTVRRAFGASWEQLPGAAVAFVASRPAIACGLLGPHDEGELAALLDQAQSFEHAAHAWQSPAPGLPDRLLEPSRWPQEAQVGE